MIKEYMLLINKYTPKNVKETCFHKKTLEMLDIMSKDPSLPHIIFYGPHGSGKKTIIKLFLEMLYNKDINNIVNTKYNVSGSGGKPTKTIVKQSNYHIVIEPNNNHSDKYLVQDIVKTYARKGQLHVFQTKKNYKTILINTVDYMSYYAQTSLRRTMEKYSKSCKFIMWCHSLSKVIDPLKSRCICIKIPSPEDNEIFRYAVKIASNENIKMTLDDYTHVVKQSNGNIKKLLWLLENKRLGLKKMVTYDEKIERIVSLIIEKNINNIHEIREILYNIIITNINVTKILFDLIESLCRKDITEKEKINIYSYGSTIDNSIVKCRRSIIHLDNFSLTVMKIIKNKK